MKRSRESRTDAEGALELTYKPSTTRHREAEMERITGFLRGCLEEKRGGSLYVCGLPGTGKTLHVERAVDAVMAPQEKGKKQLKVTTLKGTSFASGEDFLRTIVEILAPPRIQKEVDIGSMRVKDLLETLTSALTVKRKSYTIATVIVDEIDSLIAVAQDAVSKLFDVAQKRQELGFCLVGIANAIDLPQRTLGISPTEVVVFEAYNHETLLAILKDRLTEYPGLFEDTALQYCARKVAAGTGDARKALDFALKALRTCPDGETVSFRVAKAAFDDAAASTLVTAVTKLPARAKLALKAAVKLALTSSTFSKRDLRRAYTASLPALGGPDATADEAIGLLEASGFLVDAGSSTTTGKKKKRVGGNNRGGGHGTSVCCLGYDLKTVQDALAAPSTK